MDFLKKIQKQASKKKRTIVLPETGDSRILEAASYISKEEIADIILLGNEDEILTQAHGSNFDLESCRILDPNLSSELQEELIELLYDLRKEKGLSQSEAKNLAQNPLYFGALLVKAGKADGMVAGAVNPTGDVLKPALQIIKTVSGINSVSGAFIMILPDKSFGADGIMIMADCAVNPEVDADTLGEIAVVSGGTARRLAGIEPKIAMLSFSTKGSADHPLVVKVQQATAKAKELDPDLSIDGEMQADAALISTIAERKAPGSKVAGQANVLIFPDLQSGNIGYKLVQRLAGAEAVGPIIQGLDKPVNDLSRGCSVDDIINLTAITALQVQ